jgi:hypothetical protein
VVNIIAGGAPEGVEKGQDATDYLASSQRALSLSLADSPPNRPLFKFIHFCMRADTSWAAFDRTNRNSKMEPSYLL